MSRSFTYIDDVIESIQRLINKPAKKMITLIKNEPNPAIVGVLIEFSISVIIIQLN